MIAAEREAVLAALLGEDPTACTVAAYDDCLIETGCGEFLVLTEEEAEERVQEYVGESVWAFNADFLAGYMPDGIGAEEIEAIRGDRCESANGALLALLRSAGVSLEEFSAAAVAADGRGHFLSSYDGEEQEAGSFLVYRVN